MKSLYDLLKDRKIKEKSKYLLEIVKTVELSPKYKKWMKKPLDFFLQIYAQQTMSNFSRVFKNELNKRGYKMVCHEKEQIDKGDIIFLGLAISGEDLDRKPKVQKNFYCKIAPNSPADIKFLKKKGYEIELLAREISRGFEIYNGNWITKNQEDQFAYETIIEGEKKGHILSFELLKPNYPKDEVFKNKKEVDKLTYDPPYLRIINYEKDESMWIDFFPCIPTFNAAKKEYEDIITSKKRPLLCNQNCELKDCPYAFTKKF